MIAADYQIGEHRSNDMPGKADKTGEAWRPGIVGQEGFASDVVTRSGSSVGLFAVRTIAAGRPARDVGFDDPDRGVRGAARPGLLGPGQPELAAQRAGGARRGTGVRGALCR